jgi:hypothetical protein
VLCARKGPLYFMENKEILYKVVAFLDRTELDFLDQVTKDLFFTTGKKVPRSELIKEIIDLSLKSKDLKDEIITDIKINKGVNHA